MNLNFSYRMLAVIETEGCEVLDSRDHVGLMRSANEIHSAMIWKNAGQYALVSHFQLAEVCRLYDEAIKLPDAPILLQPLCIFWDDCIPIPNELAEKLLWKREPENKSDETDNRTKSDSK